MPFKTDALLYELHTRPTKDEEGKPLLYARPVQKNKVTVKEADTLCASKGGFSRGMMTLAFENFIDICADWLTLGYRIETPIGVFAPKLKMKGDFSDPAKVQSDDIYCAGIDWTPSKSFLKAVKDRIRGYRKGNNHVGNDQMNDEELMKAALRKSMVQGFTTIRRFQAYSGLKYYSAQHYLDKMSGGENPCLTKERIGSTYQYFWKK